MTITELRGLTTVSVEQAAQVLGIGRTSAWLAVHSGELPSLRLNARTVRVPVPALLRMLGAEGGDVG